MAMRILCGPSYQAPYVGEVINIPINLIFTPSSNSQICKSDVKAHFQHCIL